MSDFFEIDFLNVESKKSGDAIPLRYSIGGVPRIHVTDGGFQDTGDKIIGHINKYYNYPDKIDAVIVSHPDGDHAGGLRKVLEEFKVSELWMLRPWLYAHELIYRFARFKNVENLIRRLKDIYPNIAALEEIATDKDIPMYEPFQGAWIGAFLVLAPTKERYLNLVVQSEDTPEATKEFREAWLRQTSTHLERRSELVYSDWGEEIFSSEETSSENEMSVIQYADLCQQKILLTADAGRGALTEAAIFAELLRLIPGIDRFQVPHHGSRRNVSSEVLDRWLGRRFQTRPQEAPEFFTAIVSASKEDEGHPRKSVTRACIHRGARVYSTEDGDFRTHQNAPTRNWVSASILPYPEVQEPEDD